MKKLTVVLLVVLIALGALFAQGAAEATGQIKIGALIRNLNETFLRDYADNLKVLADKAESPSISRMQTAMSTSS